MGREVCHARAAVEGRSARRGGSAAGPLR